MVPIVPVQSWIARAALGWSVTDLARAAEVSRETVRDFERGGSLGTTNVEAIRRALEKAGVSWIDAKDGRPSARLRKGWRVWDVSGVCPGFAITAVLRRGQIDWAATLARAVAARQEEVAERRVRADGGLA